MNFAFSKISPIVLLFALALSPVFTSCEKDKDKPTVAKSLVGEWEIEAFMLDGVDYKGTVVVESQLEFKAEKNGDADFKWFISYSDGDSETIRGEYEIDEDDKVIELHPTGGITLELEYDLNGDELELTGVLDGQDLELVAEKE